MNFELTEEQLMVKDMARRFAETEIKPKAAELDEKHEHPAEIVKQLGELKMMGIAVPEEYGGGGMDQLCVNAYRNLQGVCQYRGYHVREQLALLLSGDGLWDSRTENEIPFPGCRRRKNRLLWID
jgi:hypothetical protein